MKTFLVAISFLLCIAGVASSQSLADIAKKEKERRDENARQGNKTAFEAEGVGSFGRVWWREGEPESVAGEAPSEASVPGGEPSAKSGAEALKDDTTPKDGTISKRGDLPLRKSSGRRRR